MQKFRFQYQFEGKGLENNFDPSVKLSDRKILHLFKNRINSKIHYLRTYCFGVFLRIYLLNLFFSSN